MRAIGSPRDHTNGAAGEAGVLRLAFALRRRTLVGRAAPAPRTVTGSLAPLLLLIALFLTRAGRAHLYNRGSSHLCGCPWPRPRPPAPGARPRRHWVAELRRDRIGERAERQSEWNLGENFRKRRLVSEPRKGWRARVGKFVGFLHGLQLQKPAHHQNNEPTPRLPAGAEPASARSVSISPTSLREAG